MATVQVNGKPYEMDFSLGVFRALGRKWGLNSLPETMQKVALIEKIGEGAWESYDVFFEIAHMAISRCDRNTEKISLEQLENISIAEITLLGEQMSKGIEESFKTQSAEEKKIPAPKKVN